jgi:hypothetical protein
MTNARWQDVDADIASAKEHLAAAVSAYRSGKPADMADYWNAMAFQHAMYAGYTSFEAGVERVFAMLGEDLPVGRDWHRKLLERAASELRGERPALIDGALLGCAEELLRFRHVTMHSYDRFDPRRAEPAVVAAEAFLAIIDDRLSAMKAAVDPAL